MLESKPLPKKIATRKTIELDPNNAIAYYNLGNILGDLGKLKEAEEQTLKAITLNPNYVNAHLNMGNILCNLGQFKKAENYYINAIKLNPNRNDIASDLLNLLTIYKPEKIAKNPLYQINEKYKEISIYRKGNNLITDNEAIKIYRDGLKIYKQNNLNLESTFSQIYQTNEINLNCKRHKLIFDQHKVIPEFCFGCYKVQIEVESIIELIKLFLVFNNIEFKNNNTRKCMIEVRKNILGFYKGLIYCYDLNEAFNISQQIDYKIQTNIRINLISKVKRGCSEYQLEFPQYKDIRRFGDQPMQYNKKWKSIENEIDKGNKNWGGQRKSIEGFNLNDFLIMRNWIAYAQKIGDLSVNKITHEKIEGHKSFSTLKRNFNLEKNSN